MPMADALDPAARAEFVTFAAGGQSFSLAIGQVREIRRWAPVTPLPHAPRGVRGVMNLRGAVVPIYDLAVRMGLDPTPDGPRNVVVIATSGPETVGLLVESVSEILSVAHEEVHAAPDLGGARSAPDAGAGPPVEAHGEALLGEGCARPPITGLIAVEEGLTRVIDLAAVIAPRRAPASAPRQDRAAEAGT